MGFHSFVLSSPLPIPVLPLLRAVESSAPLLLFTSVPCWCRGPWDWYQAGCDRWGTVSGLDRNANCHQIDTCKLISVSTLRITVIYLFVLLLRAWRGWQAWHDRGDMSKHFLHCKLLCPSYIRKKWQEIHNAVMGFMVKYRHKTLQWANLTA